MDPNTSWATATAPPTTPPRLCFTVVTSYVLPCVYAVFSAIGLLGNTLSLWVFIGRITPAASNSVNLCMSHLCICNLLLSLITPVMAAYYALGPEWPLDGFLCQLILHFVGPVFYININMSIFILAWVALSRFATLVQHKRAPSQGCCAKLLPPRFFARLTKHSTARRVCTGVWLLAVGVILPCRVIYSITEPLAYDGGGAQPQVCYSSNLEIVGSTTSSMMWPFLAFFYLLYLMVLLFYAIVLRHIQLSRRSAAITTTQALLGRVYRNIVVIQVVLSVCLLPYHIFRPIFIIMDQRWSHLPTWNNCHPLSVMVELKNCLLCLAALRGSTDPLMYFLLDKTFRLHVRRLFQRRGQTSSPEKCETVTGRESQSTGGAEATVSFNHCN